MPIRIVLSAISSILICFTLLAERPAVAAELVTVNTPESGALKFYFDLPNNPKATVVMFVGGDGQLKLSGGGSNGVRFQSLGGNFLARTHDKFAAHGFAVALVDTPEHEPKLRASYRISEARAGDIAAVVKHIESKTKAPIWLVGTSMGSLDVPNGAIALKGRVKGLVLTSSITRTPESWGIHETHPDGVINMPVLVTSHKDDGCDKTPAADANKLAAAFTASPKTQVMIFEGGNKPKSKPCNAKSQHGYYGIEGQVVDAIAGFIKAN